ncbi:hypothetical protein P171DRAFT_473556 [Karstenula rhodostoma CBS 690.94]|uniref:BTB domain-containing protein n=1 Tax=Karstenula rhodostoma CBS 690.94 TaxID=1392251 RepID=A0A9P4UCT4_9PLEO|nr:hypothetical protein P171DRAFT_473556 [Karstenula rhodostoma CBS 690.94]
MAPTFEDIVQSHLFTFCVGQDGKRIVVHAAAIAATSPQLNALINNGMEESSMRCAKLDDIEVDDFNRFCEYAYRGDYTVPPWENLPLEPEPTPDKNQKGEDDDDWGDPTPVSRKKKGKKGRIYEEAIPDVPDEPMTEPEPEPEPQYELQFNSRTILRTQFDSRNHIIDGGPITAILQSFEPKANSFPWQNFTPVFLAHARLYCFAHMRLIAPLKALTLNKLHKTLSKFKLYTDRVGDIIELARYAYLNQDLPSRSKDGTLDDLKKLVVEYIACEIDVIGKHDAFVEYMEEGGEFVGDFWKVARDFMN